MTKYLMRLDDASEYMDIQNWYRIEEILDKYQIKPIVGIIPDNQDSQLAALYEKDGLFWKKAEQWVKKGWTPALHGCEHRYITKEGGINPVNKRSEFAGLSYEIQAEKIERGWKILKEHGITPDIFFAPSHTFDKNTLDAIRNTTTIRVINDTVANDIYKEGDFWFIPQQSGHVRKLPLKVVTFCYHPNTMKDTDYEILEDFLKKNGGAFVVFEPLLLKNRKLGIWDRILRKIYFIRRRA